MSIIVGSMLDISSRFTGLLIGLGLSAFLIAKSIEIIIKGFSDSIITEADD